MALKEEKMNELLFDDIFMVETLDPDGKKYDKGMDTFYFFVSFHFHVFKDEIAVWFWTWKVVSTRIIDY